MLCVYGKKDKNELMEIIIVIILVNHFFSIEKATARLPEFNSLHTVVSASRKNRKGKYSLGTNQHWKPSYRNAYLYGYFI